MQVRTRHVIGWMTTVSVALGLLLGVTASLRAQDITEAFIVPLFPQKERELKNGFPPGMTPYSFWAARGTVGLTKLSTLNL